jgi:hypothetical protein
MQHIADSARSVLYTAIATFLLLVVGRGAARYLLSLVPKHLMTRLGDKLVEASRYTVGERQMCALLGRTCPACWERREGWVVRFHPQGRDPCHGKG